jgi:hypothetical protein
MKIRSLLATCITGTVLVTTTAYADHNSVGGKGWANMPNDIHNIRIETLGDNEEFTEFVREDGGTDSVNDAVLDPDVVTPGSRADTQTTNAGVSAAGSMSRSAARTSVRSSAPVMQIGGRR